MKIEREKKRLGEFRINKLATTILDYFDKQKAHIVVGSNTSSCRTFEGKLKDEIFLSDLMEYSPGVKPTSILLACKKLKENGHIGLFTDEMNLHDSLLELTCKGELAFAETYYENLNRKITWEKIRIAAKVGKFLVKVTSASLILSLMQVALSYVHVFGLSFGYSGCG
ncbi:MAG: hypothetical protein RIB71_11025 [Imperialibacter sp.]|uniref:hypothetical protein n=1 Tax=Imperialibacter sp. TaxID=2038411 RepID=UPI0032EC5049